MKSIVVLILIITLFSCNNEKEFVPRSIVSIEFETLIKDSLLNIRAIELLDDGNLSFATNNGVYGLYDPSKKIWQT